MVQRPSTNPNPMIAAGILLGLTLFQEAQTSRPKASSESPLERMVSRLIAATDSTRRETVDQILNEAASLDPSGWKTTLYLVVLEACQEHGYDEEASVLEVGLGNMYLASDDYKRAGYYLEAGLPGFAKMEPSVVSDVRRNLLVCA